VEYLPVDSTTKGAAAICVARLVKAGLVSDDEPVAGPLGLDFWIGLPESEEPRVARLDAAPPPTDPEALAMMMQIAGAGGIAGDPRTVALNDAVRSSLQQV